MGVLDETLTGLNYRDDILQNYGIPHFDDNNLASRPVFMDDHARPHRAQIVQQYLQDEAINFLGQLSHPIWTILSKCGIKSGNY